MTGEQTIENTALPETTTNDTPPRKPRSHAKRPHRAKNKVGATLSPLDKAKAKAAFLLSMSRRNNSTEACEAAHIDYKTYYYWLEHGYLTVEELQEARQKFDDKCRGIVLNLAIDGEEEFLANNGHLVPDDKGQPIKVRRRDTRVTLKYIERMLEEFKQQPFEVNITVDNKRRDYEITIPVELCTPNEFAYLKRLATRLDKRSLGEAGTMSEGIHTFIDGSIEEQTGIA